MNGIGELIKQTLSLKDHLKSLSTSSLLDKDISQRLKYTKGVARRMHRHISVQRPSRTLLLLQIHSFNSLAQVIKP